MLEIAGLLEMVLNSSLHSFWFTVGSSGSFLFCFMEASVVFIEITLLFQFIRNLDSREEVNLDSLIRQSRWSTAVASPLA